MFFRMLKQSFKQAKKQKTLAIITMLLSTSLITALLNISIDVGDKMSSELKSYGANISIIPKSESLSMEVGGVDYNPLKGKVFLDESNLPNIKDIFWRNNIVGFAPFLSEKVLVDGKTKVNIEGTFFNKNLPVPDEDEFKTGIKDLFNYWEITGKSPKDDSDEALVGVNLAKISKLKIGDIIKISNNNKNKNLKITGILSSGAKEDNYIITSLSIVQDLFALKGKISRVQVSALSVPEDDLSRKSRRNPDALDALEYDSWYCTAYVGSIAYQIEEAFANSSVKPIWQVAASQGTIIEKIQLLMAVVTIAAIIASALGISSLISSIIMQRSREIGLMKALGASKEQIYILFLSESALIGLIGGILGFILGCALSQMISYSIFDAFVAIQWVVLPIALISSVIISLLGSLIPSLMISKLLLVDVLYGRR